MRFFPLSYNGFLFNQENRVASEFNDYDWDVSGIQTNNSPVDGKRPAYSGTVFNGALKVTHVVLKNPNADREALILAADLSGVVQYNLYSLDELGNEWYVKAKCVGINTEENDGVTAQFGVVFEVNDPTWISVKEYEETWSIVADEEIHIVTIGGNQPTNATYEFTPGAPAGYYPYVKYIKNYNPIAYTQTDGIDITNGGLNTAALVADTTVSNLINEGAGINASVTTWQIDNAVGGGLSASGGTFYMETEQCSYVSITGAGTQINGVVRGINGTTAASHANNVPMYRSLVMANGYDIRVFMDGAEIPRWFGGGGMNNASTKIFISQKWLPGQSMQLRTAIANTGLPTRVEWKVTTAIKTALSKLPKSGIIRIDDNEEFSYTNLNASLCQADLVARELRGTSLNTHAVGATCWWVEHDIQLVFGNSFAEEPMYDETYKPIFDLDTSTNTSRVYSVFTDEANLRVGSFIRQVIYDGLGKLNRVYTGNQGASDDVYPATDMGMEVASYQVQGKAKPETADLAWMLYHPAIITTVTMTGEKFKSFATSTFPTRAGLESSVDGKVWGLEWNEVAPSVADTWTALAKDSIAETITAGRRYIRFRLYGSVNGLLSNFARLEINGLTMVLTTANVIQVGITATEANFQMTLEIRNNRTNESLFIDFPAAQGETLIVDSENLSALYKGVNSIRAVSWDGIRTDWLKLLPGENPLQYYSDQTGPVQVVIKRNNKAM